MDPNVVPFLPGAPAGGTPRRRAPGRPPGEAEFVRRLRASDAAAFGELVRRYEPKMRAVARRILRRPEDAEDAVQDALLRAVRGIDGFEGRSALGTWLHCVTVRSALMRMRSRRRRREFPFADGPGLPQAEDRASASGEAPLDALLRRETGLRVRRCVARLSGPPSEALELRRTHGLPLSEIARCLDVDVLEVRRRLRAARRTLRAHLADEFRERRIG